jgi:hypothetical protein
MRDDEPLVVSRHGIQLPPESVRPPSGDGPGEDDVTVALTVNRYTRALELLEEATAESDPGVMVTVQDREASLLQSRIAEQADGADVEELSAGGKEVKFGTRLEDPWGWIRSYFDHVDASEFHPILRPGSTAPEPLADGATIGLLSDWGTGLYGAPVSAQTLAATGGFDLLMHLGDVYYSGTPKETAERFADVWPTGAAAVSRALNGNHEMYSGGHAYFEHTLPAFGQEASYFAMANARWLLIGLDSAYVDHALDAEQAGWVNRVVAEHGGDRRVLLFSHHQLFSRLEHQGPKLEEALGGLLRSGRVAAWYWGHEHDCALYDAHPGYGLRARLLGNGGIPAFRKQAVRNAPSVHDAAGVSWRRLEATPASPAAEYLDGPNPYIKGKEEKFVPHGYVTLELGAERLLERLHLPDGTEIRCTEIA